MSPTNSGKLEPILQKLHSACKTSAENLRAASEQMENPGQKALFIRFAQQLRLYANHQAVLAEQLGAINQRCREHGIPATTSFAYPGNAVTPEAFGVLRKAGIRFARRGGTPEYTYESGRGLAHCLRKTDKVDLARDVVRQLLEWDPSDPVKLRTWVEGWT